MRTIIRPLALYCTFFICLMAFLGVEFGCTSSTCRDPQHASDPSCVAQRVLLDCTGGNVQAAVDQYGPTVKDIFDHGKKSDGSIDYDLIGGDLEAAAIKYGGCVVSHVFSQIIFAKSVTATGASQAAAAKDAFEKLRAREWPTTKFHTASGDL
jgi:hypothetical protein